MINLDFIEINNAKLVGRLLPFWARGKNISLLLQAILGPLVSVHKSFKAWALERYIECNITAQRPSIEWYLKYKLKQHFYNEEDVFFIVNGVNESLNITCFNTGLWENNAFWNNSLLWENEDTGEDYDDNLEVVGQTNIYAPAIIDTVDYDHEDYKRDIQYIMSKFMINFNKINIIIANINN